jgi:hypothetical protein
VAPSGAPSGAMPAGAPRTSCQELLRSARG